MSHCEWRPIDDEIPKDGRYIYVSSRKMGIPVLARFVEEQGDFQCCPAYAVHGKADGIMEVTHWMPLPPPPEQ